MIRVQIIGHLGRDAEVHIHGTDSVINFSVAHTDKWKESNGQVNSRTTWVSCYWWTDKTNIAQYLKKGQLIYLEGVPEARVYKSNDGTHKGELRCRVLKVELLGGDRRDDQQGHQPAQQQPQQQQNFTGYQPAASDISSDGDDLPF